MASACHHGGASVRSAASIAEALARARDVCAEDGERWEGPRARVYELLLASGHPVKAYDLIATLRPGGVAKPPTVYRALEFLLTRGLAHRLETEAAFVPCALEHPHAQSAGFLICDCCGQVTELDLSEPGVPASALRLGFVVSRTVIEAHGVCSRCGEGRA